MGSATKSVESLDVADLGGHAMKLNPFMRPLGIRNKYRQPLASSVSSSRPKQQQQQSRILI
jgi:hypothetical protein